MFENKTNEGEYLSPEMKVYDVKPCVAVMSPTTETGPTEEVPEN